MMPITEQLASMAEQLKDIEAAKRAVDKSTTLTKKELQALSDAKRSMQSLSTYNLLKPSMDSASQNLENKLVKLNDLSTLTEDTLEQFYDLIADLSVAQRDVLNRIAELDVLPSHSKSATEDIIETPVDITTDTLPETEDLDSDFTPQVIKGIDEIAPKPQNSEDTSLMESLHLNPNSKQESTSISETAGQLSDFSDLDAKLSGAFKK
mgnify:CR=1 FL=1